MDQPDMGKTNKQELIAQYLAKKLKSIGKSIPRLSTQEYTPLSFGQERLWFLYQLEKDSLAYNRPMILRLRGNLKIHLFKDCINTILERHDVLRTIFPLVGGEPVAKSRTSSDIPFPIEDLTNYPPLDRMAAAYEKMDHIIDRPFLLNTGPVARLHLYRLDIDDHIFLFVTHHITFDAWSEKIFINEIAGLYESLENNGGDSIPNPSIQYADFAQWQRNQVFNGKYNNQLNYWKEKLGSTSALNLPLDFPRPPIQTFSGASKDFNLPKPLIQALKNLYLQDGATLFMILLSGYLTLLHRYTNEVDIVVGTPIAGRKYKETQKTIGLFIKTLALRTGMKGNPTFRELISRVRRVALEAFSFSDVPFEKIVEELRPKRSLARTPIFQVFFNLENIPEPANQMDGIKIERLIPETKYVQYDISIELHEKGDSIKGNLEYNTDLFRDETISRMIGQYISLLESISLNPDQKIGYLSFMNKSEFHQITQDWNDTSVHFPDKLCLHHLFEKQVRQTPEATALVFDQKSITYSELNNHANQLAHFLSLRGVGKGSRVGIYFPKSLEMIVSVIGVMKTRAAYVPLDPSFPKERLESLVIDAQVQVILDGFPPNNIFDNLDCEIIPLEKIQNKLTRNNKSNPDLLSEPGDLIYIVYTSGSTGKPKGIPISHRSVVNYLDYFTRYCKLKTNDIVLQIPPLSFDASVEDIFGTLISGGKLVLLKEESLVDMGNIFKVIEQEGITCILSTVPSFWRAFSSYAANHLLNTQTVRLITISGEVLYYSDCKKLWEIFGSKTSLINTYGPTECTIVTTYYQIPKNLEKDIPVYVGRPIQNTQVYILDDYLSPVPIGIVGEMYIGGAGLAVGYLNRPRLTAENFIPNTFVSKPGDRLYRTGDMARYHPDGVIEFLGRNDRQVKIRGNRVEIGEVESVIRTHSSIGDVAVVSEKDTLKETLLIAHVTPLNQKSLPDVSELRNYLQKKLADYMVPSIFIFLDTLPITSTGKIDYQALPPPDRNRLDLGSTFIAPRTDVEKTLSDIWSKHLRLERIGINDDFFDLGGHSLMAIRIVSEIEIELGKEIPLSALFQSTTIETLANFIQDDKPSSEWENLVAIQTGGYKPPIFCIPPAASTAMRFEKLSKYLKKDQPLYGFNYPGMDGKSEPIYSIPDLAKGYILEILRVQPEGPYFICGMCYGGNVAFEIAQHLISQGHQVAFLGIIDSNYAPGKRKPLKYYIYTIRHFIKRVILNKETQPGEFIKMRRGWRTLETDPLGVQINKVFKANIIARLAHTSPPYPGKITKFSTKWYVAERATEQWRKATTVGLDDHKIPGSHLPRSPEDTGFMDEPNVKIFAQIFNKCLESSRNT
jgi:aspartate racemase